MAPRSAKARQISTAAAADGKVWSPKKHVSTAQKLHGTTWRSEVAWLEKRLGPGLTGSTRSSTSR